MKNIFIAVLIVCCAISATANPFLKSKNDSLTDTFNKDYIYNVAKISTNLKIDGVLDETEWLSAEKADNFSLVLPIDTGYPIQPSEVLMAYNEKSLYMAFVFYDTIPGKRIMESYRRDFMFGNNDNFLSFFDTFLDQTNGFSFGISASGAKWDGTMSDGARVSLSWDCKWESKTKHYPDKWITEMRIPFKSIRYPSGSKQWNVNFSRLDLKTNEKSAWAPVPRQFPTASLAYTGVMKFEEPLSKSKIMLSMIPYVFGSYAKDFEAGTGASWKKDFGFDAKVGISSSMNLDLTYNPDFAQVEVDQQVTNIDRFELFFPEKRQFFLENSDLFSGFGFNTVTPFFSRRIGLDAPVLAGMRLSGKIGSDWRIGFMNMTTQKTDDFLARNFTVASVQKKVFARSNFGFILVNKEYLNQPDGEDHFNRVVGFDYNLATKDNSWTGKFFYHRSFRPTNPDKQYSQGTTLNYTSKNLRLGLSQASVGENFLAEAGFIRRNGYNSLSPNISYLFVPNKKITSHGISLQADNYFDKNNNLLDYNYNLSYQFDFENRSEFSVGIIKAFIKLQEDFDPTHVNDHVLVAGTEYNYSHYYVSYESDNRKLFKWDIFAAKGGLYNGDINMVEGSVGYRYQPYANISLNFNYTDIMLPQPFERTKLWLIGPKLDLTFTDKIFLSTFVQYNEQIDNVNVNVRFQWRYQPVSDFYIVYTDNYMPKGWSSRNRALVFKVSYWLN